MPAALLNYAALMGWNADLQHNSEMNQRGVLTLPDLEKHVGLNMVNETWRPES